MLKDFITESAINEGYRMLAHELVAGKVEEYRAAWQAGNEVLLYKEETLLRSRYFKRLITSAVDIDVLINTLKNTCVNDFGIFVPKVYDISINTK